MNREIVVIDNQIQLQTCSLYSHHVPILNNHHVGIASWFIAAGLSPELSPMALLCANCHESTHAAIDGTIKGQHLGLLPPRARKLATQAFTIAAQFNLTPALTL